MTLLRAAARTRSVGPLRLRARVHEPIFSADPSCGSNLTEIARWAIVTFGLRHAELYEAELLDRCISILNGQAYSQSCAVLVDDIEDLRFVRAGEHFLVFLHRLDEVIILDILHSRSALPRHVASLSTL